MPEEQITIHDEHDSVVTLQPSSDQYQSQPPEIEESKEKKGLGCLAKLIIIFIVLIIIVILTATLAYAYYLNEINKPLTQVRDESGVSINKDTNTVTLTIERGMSTTEIAAYLSEQGLLKHPEFLRAYMYLNQGKIIQAGFYRIDIKDKNLPALIEEFQKGSFEKKLTFIEGWRLEEYKDYLTETMGEEYANQFIASEEVEEGYMFPDTYIIEADYEPGYLASWMRNTFDSKVTQEMIDIAEFRNLSLEEVVILASIVEREMNIKSERPKVAGIMVKRYKNGWPLQADATVQYALGSQEDWWPVVTSEDIKNTNSPYNTYQNNGLPPGPIANPSLSSIEAVVNYEDTPYWFYITAPDGTTYYAETLDEHNANIQKYLN